MPYYLLSLLGLFLLACSPSEPPENPDIHRPRIATPLNVTLNMTQPSYSIGLPVTLRFVLHNNEEDTVSFCYLNSPAHEMVWSNYFAVTNEAGKVVPYIGSRALYRGYPDPQYTLALAPGEVKIYTVDLLPLYALTEPGRYNVRFIGDKINLLPNSTPAQFVLE
jgi:hypothetical protein